MSITRIFTGFPGTLVAGYMEWSTCVLIQLLGKNILFDTGGTGRRVHLCPKLAYCGLRPEDVDILCISHFHSDHIYNFDYFTNAAILLHTAEIAYIEENLTNGGDPWQPLFLYAPLKESGRLKGVKEGDVVAPGASIVHLPGHTPGSMGLLLEDGSIPATLLAGDAVKNIAELASGRAPMSKNEEATASSIRKARSIAQHIIPGHDRPLLVEKDCIRALEAARETIIVPANVVDTDAVRRLELTLEPSTLPILNNS